MLHALRDNSLIQPDNLRNHTEIDKFNEDILNHSNCRILVFSSKITIKIIR